MAKPPVDGVTLLRRLILPGLFVIALFVVLWVRRDGPAPGDDFALNGDAFGTTWTVRAVAKPDSDLKTEQLRERVVGVLKTVDQQMSTWRDDSELSVLNATPVGEPLPISENLATVLRRARTISIQSSGAFDITVGPLVAAWGFGAGRKITPPTDEELAELRSRIGYQHVSTMTNAARRTADVRIDLSAIAKGYAVDLIGAELRRLGLTDWMVEVGGEVLTSGNKGDGNTWRIGIERPQRDARSTVRQVLNLSGKALATSGDYRQFREIDGVMVSHAIDPRTGRPTTSAVASVSVVADDCTSADAWATALMVLGPDGIHLAERQGMAVFMAVRAADGTLSEHQTPDFADFLPSE